MSPRTNRFRISIIAKGIINIGVLHSRKHGNTQPTHHKRKSINGEICASGKKNLSNRVEHKTGTYESPAVETVANNPGRNFSHQNTSDQNTFQHENIGER